MNTLVSNSKLDREVTTLRRMWLGIVRLTVASLVVSAAVAAFAVAWAASANVRDLSGLLFH